MHMCRDWPVATRIIAVILDVPPCKIAWIHPGSELNEVAGELGGTRSELIRRFISDGLLALKA